MALIKCPECGKEVSDKSVQCVNCGYPLKSASEKAVEMPKTAEKYKVILVGYNDDAKVRTIKIVRDLTNLGLAEAKELVDNCPRYVVGNVTNDEFENIKKTFADAGAWVRRENMSENEFINMPNSSSQSISFSKMKICPTCGKSISSNADNCPYCGHSYGKKNQKNGLSFWGVVGAIIVAVLIMMFL